MLRPTLRDPLIWTAILLASPAPAQPPAELPAPQDAEQIVVTATRERERQVREFVSALTPPAGAGSIPRFIDEVCPSAVGLHPAQNEMVTARLRRVIPATGLRVAPRGCAPNAILVVTRSKRAFIEAMAVRRSWSFGMMTAREIRRLARSPGPAAAWHLTGPVDESDAPLRYDDRMGAYVNETMQAASRIRSPGRLGFDASIVVVETRALQGLTATQLADYAAMRLFARFDPARLPAPPPPTILTVLEAPMGSAIPITLTDWDIGLLRGLYTAARDLNPAQQRSQISEEVMRELESPGR